MCLTDSIHVFAIFGEKNAHSRNYQFVPKRDDCSSSPLLVWRVGFTNQAFAMGSDGEVLLYRVPWQPWRWDMLLERNGTAKKRNARREHVFFQFFLGKGTYILELYHLFHSFFLKKNPMVARYFLKHSSSMAMVPKKKIVEIPRWSRAAVVPNSSLDPMERRTELSCWKSWKSPEINEANSGAFQNKTKRNDYTGRVFPQKRWL